MLPTYRCFHIQPSPSLKVALRKESRSHDEKKKTRNHNANEDNSNKLLFFNPQHHMTIFTESFRDNYNQVLRVLQLFAEPIARPSHLHEYRITSFSLGGAVASGISPTDLFEFLLAHTHNAPMYGMQIVEDYYYNQETSGGEEKEEGDDGQQQQQDKDDQTLKEWRMMFRFLADGIAAHTKARVVLERDQIQIECEDEATALFLAKDKLIASQLVKNAEQPDGNNNGANGTSSFITKVDLHGDEDGVDVDELPTTTIATEAVHANEEEGDAGGDDAGHGQQLRDKQENVLRSIYILRLRDHAARKYVAERALQLGVPLRQEFDFHNDDGTTPIANLILRTSAKPRDYQVAAVEAAIGSGRCRSGVIVLPCGAGKTMVGILLMCCLKRRTMIVCASTVSVEQWKNQLLEFAQFGDDNKNTAGDAQEKIKRGRIACLTGKHKDEITSDTNVVITTFNTLAIAHKLMLKLEAAKLAGGASAAEALPETTKSVDQLPVDATGRRVAKKKSNPKEALLTTPYGLLLLDECHAVPAEYYRESVAYVPARSVVGLTATFVREDSKIDDLFHIIGPKLYDAPWQELCQKGYLADVTCVELHCPMSYEFAVEYINRDDAYNKTLREQQEHNKQQIKTGLEAPAQLLTLLAAANPNKIAATKALVEEHVNKDHKVLVFCDHILLLKRYAEELGNVPTICGETQHADRMKIFSDFQSTKKTNVVCVSRVGDVSVNLPSANVVIQVSSHGGSRRQEAQRLGRILRPKDKAADGSTIKAWFYSLVSEGTLEMRHAAHRSAFLVNQGYECHVRRFDESDLPAQYELLSRTGQEGEGHGTSKQAGSKKKGHGAMMKKEDGVDGVAPGILQRVRAATAPVKTEENTSSDATLGSWKKNSSRNGGTSTKRLQWLAIVVSKWETVKATHTSVSAGDAGTRKNKKKGGGGRRRVKREDDDTSDDEEEQLYDEAEFDDAIADEEWFNIRDDDDEVEEGTGRARPVMLDGEDRTVGLPQKRKRRDPAALVVEPQPPVAVKLEDDSTESGGNDVLFSTEDELAGVALGASGGSFLSRRGSTLQLGLGAATAGSTTGLGGLNATMSTHGSLLGLNSFATMGSNPDIVYHEFDSSKNNNNGGGGDGTT